MKKKIFIPVLKTKRATEKHILEKLSEKYTFDDSFLPLIEWTRDSRESSVKKYAEILKDAFHLESVYRRSNSSIDEIINKTSELRKTNNIVPCLKILKEECKKHYYLIDKFINNEKEKGAIALNISIENDIDCIVKIGNQLSDNDYLIIDIGLDNIKYIKSLSTIKNKITSKNNIIILTEERNTSLGNKEYAKCNYNGDWLFNFSVIDSIKNDSFDFDGFASYCTLKNDMTGEDQIATKTYAIVFLYSSDNNSMFTLRTDELMQTASSYVNLTNKILESKEYIERITEKIKKSPLAGEVFNNIIRNKKGSVVKYQEIAVFNYIESVIRDIIRS